MADVSVIAPDGTAGSVPEDQLDAALADGFRVDAPEGPGAVASAAPAGPVEVEVRAPDGTLGTVPESELDAALADGFEDMRDAQYRTTGQKIATAAEGFGRGVSMGATDAVQTAGAGLGTGIGNWVADKLIGETPGVERPLFDSEAAQASYGDIQGRREANQALAIGSEVLGAGVAAVASGGVGSAGAVARMTPAGQLAALSTKMGAQLMAKAGTSVTGRLGALVATGAFEGAVDGATRQVMADLADGDVQISSERMIDGAWDAIVAGGQGALFGGAVGGGLGGLVEGAQAVGRGVKAVAKSLPSVPDFANGRAFKAALGRTNKALVDRAERFGGAEAIGETLNRMEVTSGAAGVETIAERTGQLRDKIGQEIGSMVEQAAKNGGPGPSRADLAQRIYSEVIDPLAKDAAKRPVARQLEGRVKDIIDDLTAPGDDAIGLEQLNNLRKSMDDVAAWGKRTPNESDQAYMDVRHLVSNYWSDAAEKAADAAGDAGFASRLKQLKRDYSHIAFANDAAEDAVRSKLSNRFASPSDYGVGAAAAVATGGMSLGTVATGMAGAAVNKVVREHANSVVANTLYKLAKSGVTRENALEAAVGNTMRSLALPATTAATAAGSRLRPPPSLPVPQMQQLIQQARELQDPASPASAQLDAMTLQLASESPEFADAVRNKVMQKAGFIVDKLGPQTDPSDPLKVQPMLMDRVTKARNERFIRAAADPSAALDRLATGQGSAEDLAVVRELTPSIHKAYVDRVMKQLVGRGAKASQSQLQRLHFALGVPVTREQTPQYVAAYQAMHQQAAAEMQQQQQGAQPPAKGGAKPGGDSRESPADNVYASRTDSVMTPGAE